MSRQWVAASSAVAAAVSAAILYAMPKVVPSAVGFLDAVQARVPLLRSVPDMYAVAAVVMAAVFLCAHLYEKSLGKDYPDERSYVTLFSGISAMAIGVLVWFGDASWNSVMRIAYLNYLAILWITFLKPSFSGLGSVGKQMAEARWRPEEDSDSRFDGFDSGRSPRSNERFGGGMGTSHGPAEPDRGGFSDPFFDGLASDEPARGRVPMENPYAESGRNHGDAGGFHEDGRPARAVSDDGAEKGILDKIMDDPSSLLWRLLSGQPWIGISADVKIGGGQNDGREEGFPAWDSDGDGFADFGGSDGSDDGSEPAPEDDEDPTDSEDDWRNVIASSRILMPIERIKEEFR